MLKKTSLTISIFEINKIEYKNNKNGEPFINIHCKNGINKYFYCISKKQEILKKIKDKNINVGDFILMLGIENIYLDKINQKIEISYFIQDITKINIKEWENNKLHQNNLMEVMKNIILNQDENNTNNNQEDNKEDEEFTNNILNEMWELDK